MQNYYRSCAHLKASYTLVSLQTASLKSIHQIFIQMSIMFLMDLDWLPFQTKIFFHFQKCVMYFKWGCMWNWLLNKVSKHNIAACCYIIYAIFKHYTDKQEIQHFSQQPILAVYNYNEGVLHKSLHLKKNHFGILMVSRHFFVRGSRQ